MGDQRDKDQSHFVPTTSALQHDFGSVILPRTVLFVVGDSKKEYVLHVGAIMRLSRPLHVLVNGGMREAQQGLVEWPEVDEQTFIRFSQWAYTGAYLAAEPDIISPPSEIIITPAHDAAAPGNFNTIENSKGSREPTVNTSASAIDKPAAQTAVQQPNTTEETPYSLASLLRDTRGMAPKTCPNGHAFGLVSKVKDCDTCSGNFHVMICQGRASSRSSTCNSQQFTTCSDCRARDTCIKKIRMAAGFDYPRAELQFEARQNREPTEDYSEVFLSHAKLYVVADIYCITLLASQTIQNLAETLKEFTLYKNRIGDILLLMEYVFSNTQRKDTMRDLLIHYITCTIETLNKDHGFHDLLEDYPQIVSPLIKSMMERRD
ncbi:hypothetical protein AB5N19_12398 [Seiridium cardinale]|uniref:BTB domain-containing protein n=1 Tax=Seiridium cardinale TaxID=138064 RepID=A0ABR2XTG2_9PEZI